MSSIILSLIKTVIKSSRSFFNLRSTIHTYKTESIVVKSLKLIGFSIFGLMSDFDSKFNF